MEINDKTIFFYVWHPLSDELLKELTEIIELVGDEAANNAVKVGVIPGRKFHTKAYIEREERFFRITLSFRGIPFNILRCQIDETTKKEHDEGIEKEKNDSSNTSYWI